LISICSNKKDYEPLEMDFFDGGWYNGSTMRWGETRMNIAKWVFLFTTTVAWGIGVALLIGMGVLFIDPNFTPLKIGTSGLGFNIIGTAIVGATLGAFSHMGFFAYLTLNFFAQGFFRSKIVWTYIQIFLIIVVLVYTAALRVPEGNSFLPYTILPIIVLAGAVAIAWLKMKQTNRSSFIPTLFLMTAITLLEAVPALRLNNPNSTWLMVGPLFACNAWQILQLHRLLGTSKLTK
jgi:KinB signaling pathway activation protein